MILIVTNLCFQQWPALGEHSRPPSRLEGDPDDDGDVAAEEEGGLPHDGPVLVERGQRYHPPAAKTRPNGGQRVITVRL